jgi:hypothetical protein
LTGANFIAGDTRINLTGTGIIANAGSLQEFRVGGLPKAISRQGWRGQWNRHGVTFVAGQVGQAFNFDGESSKILYNSPFIFHQPGNCDTGILAELSIASAPPVFLDSRGRYRHESIRHQRHADGTLQMDYRSPSGTTPRPD